MATCDWLGIPFWAGFTASSNYRSMITHSVLMSTINCYLLEEQTRRGSARPASIILVLEDLMVIVVRHSTVQSGVGYIQIRKTSACVSGTNSNNPVIVAGPVYS